VKAPLTATQCQACLFASIAIGHDLKISYHKLPFNHYLPTFTTTFTIDQQSRVK
jgi:hypothetical protein